MLAPHILITDLRHPSTHVPLGNWGFSISGGPPEVYNRDLPFKNKNTDLASADLIEFVRCGRNMQFKEKLCKHASKFFSLFFGA